MSAEVDTLPHNGDLEDNLTPEGLNGGGSDDDGDLFGDDDEDEVQAEANELHRKLDDSELDSGDDEGRTDRIEPTIEDDQELYEEQKNVTMLEVDMARVKPPEGDELYLLGMPPFLGLKHKAFQPSSYEPPTAPHDAPDPDDEPLAKFSAFSTASTTLFWRRDPKNPELIQSNSRFVRWSDGSITLQIASQPKDHYRVSTNPLRQGWPKKQGASQHDYDPNKDTHNYLAAPHAVVGVDLQIVAPFDATLKIQPTGDYVDESVIKLQQSLAAATQQHDPLSSLRQIRIDPEQAKKEAEKFEKDRVRANRKVEAAQERLIMRKDRVLGRSGMGGRMGGAGLSIAGLEDDDGMPAARGRKSKAKRRKTNRRGDIYSDDEDEDMPRGRREDEYDREDDFLAASDEEPEIYEDGEDEVEAEEDDPDVDDLEIEGRETVVDTRTRGDKGRKGRDRGSTPKRAASDDDDDLPTGSPQQRKKRRVIDDDDDDDE